MGRYGRELLRNIDEPANILPLKVDLHRCFDKRWFAIIPKSIGISAPYSPQYVTHILLQGAAELWPTYHNTLVQYLHENAHCYLFARFAWAILLQVKPFISAAFHVTLFESR
jgi:HNH endonuclease